MPTPRKTTILAVVNMAIEEQLGPRTGGPRRPTPGVRVRAMASEIEVALVGDARARYGSATIVTESAAGRYTRRHRALRFRPSGPDAAATLPLPKGPYVVHVDWEPPVQGLRVTNDLNSAPAL